MDKEKRKIIFQEDSYQLLKQNEDENWYKQGKKIGLQAISKLESNGTYDLEMSDCVMKEVKEYRIQRLERKKKYEERILKENNKFLKKRKNLTSKVI